MPHRLLRHSGIMFTAIMTVNLFSYLFHVYVARTLGPSEYGILGSLLAVFYILSVPLGAISMVVTKFTSEYKAKDEYRKIASLFFSSTKKLSEYAIIAFILMALASWLIADFLKVPSTIPIILTGLLLLFSAILSVPIGVLQGLQNFNQLGLNLSLEALARLILGILLISIGLGVNGAILAYGLGCFVAIFLAFIPLKFLFSEQREPLDVSEIYKFSFPTLMTSICLTIMTNIDLVFVKHFFTPEEAGIYAVASVLGKIILITSSAFEIAMFPMVSELHTAGKDSSLVLKRSLIYVALTSGVIIATYWLLPSLIIRIIYGQKYSAAIPLLGLFGVAMGLMALIIIYTRFHLAAKDMRFMKVLIISTCLQIILLALFHHHLVDIIWILIITNTITIFTLLIGKLRITRRKYFI